MLFHVIGQVLFLCFSVFQFDITMHDHVTSGAGGVYPDCPCVGNTELVSASDGDDRYTLPSPHEREYIDSTRDSESSSSTQKINT